MKIFHNRERVIAQGYTPTGITLSGPHAWELRKAALKLDTPQEHLTAFRLEDGTWEHFLKPGHQLGAGYISRPMLPPPQAAKTNE